MNRHSLQRGEGRGQKTSILKVIIYELPQRGEVSKKGRGTCIHDIISECSQKISKSYIGPVYTNTGRINECFAKDAV